jgi:glycosyltransferase involved in cell wall biosynthesis
VTAPSPRVSVVVPSFRRPDRLAALLDALAAQDVDRGDLEVVVVDDGSPEPLAPTAQAFTDRLDVRVHRQANAGPATARNVGAGLARGSLLAFTDDDCRPRPGWVRELLAAHTATPDAMLGGHVVNAVHDDVCAEASQLLLTYLYRWFDDDHVSRFFASNNLGVPRDGFEAIGGFDTGFPRPGGEDRELCERWHRSGRPLREAPAAVVDHHHAMGLRGLVRQHVNYGRGAYDVHRRRASAGGGEVEIEPVRFYLGLVAAPFTEVARSPVTGRAPSLPRRVQLSAALLVTQVANAAGFFLERRDERRRSGIAGGA